MEMGHKRYAIQTGEYGNNDWVFAWKLVPMCGGTATVPVDQIPLAVWLAFVDYLNVAFNMRHRVVQVVTVQTVTSISVDDKPPGA